MTDERETRPAPGAARVSRSLLLAALLVERFGPLDELETERPATRRQRRDRSTTRDDHQGRR